MTNVAYVSTYVPQRCGLATYTFHLKQAIQASKGWRGKDVVAALSVRPDASAESPQLWPLLKDDAGEYAKLARRINQSPVDVVSLQHEFGIFGGEAGSHVLQLLRHLDKPVATTFHTVFERPEEPYRSIQQEIADRSAAVIVMNRKAVGYVHAAFGIPEERIVYIPHGTPEPDPEGREALRQAMGWSGRKVMMTFGLLGRGKGLELVLEIMPEVAAKVPEALYVIVGQTHPEVKRREGESYREELRELIRRNGLERHVLMIDRYMEEAELVRHLMACDVYITPYPGLEQITSGTLAYAIGLGRPVLTTPYAYAADVLRDYPELLIDYGDRRAWSDKLSKLLGDERELGGWSAAMAEIGRPMRWSEVGRQHMELFASLRAPELAHG